MELHAQCIYKDPLQSWVPGLHTRRTEASPQTHDRKKPVGKMEGGISAITSLRESQNLFTHRVKMCDK